MSVLIDLYQWDRQALTKSRVSPSQSSSTHDSEKPILAFPLHMIGPLYYSCQVILIRSDQIKCITFMYMILSKNILIQLLKLGNVSVEWSNSKLNFTR